MKRSRILLLVVLSLLLILGLASTAGATTKPADDVFSSATFKLFVGESRYFRPPGMTIHFAAVLEDTRSGVTRAPAGYVTVRMKVSYDHIRVIESIDLRLIEGGRPPTATLANGYRLTLHAVSPNPIGAEPAEDKLSPLPMYEATFSLAGPVPSPTVEQAPAPVVDRYTFDRNIFGARWAAVDH